MFDKEINGKNGNTMRKEKCLNCEVNEDEKPLLAIRYQNEQLFICPQCLPILIHKPSNLAEKIHNVQKIQPSEHRD
jgi:hypothetical protein